VIRLPAMAPEAVPILLAALDTAERGGSGRPISSGPVEIPLLAAPRRGGRHRTADPVQLIRALAASPVSGRVGRGQLLSVTVLRQGTWLPERPGRRF
jgi:hypothetical protein